MAARTLGRKTVTPAGAMVLRRTGTPLVWEERRRRRRGPARSYPGRGLRRLPDRPARRRRRTGRPAELPLIPGHEVVGVVEALGPGVIALPLWRRVGAPWLGEICGDCRYCDAGRENLCDPPEFSGFTRDGGFATHVLADPTTPFPCSGSLDPVAAAPLLCAGLIGCRCLKREGEAERIRTLRPRRCGAPSRPSSRSITDARSTPSPVPATWRRRLWRAAGGGRGWGPPTSAARAARRGDPLRARGRAGSARPGAVRKGGPVVCGGIHMSDIPCFPYHPLGRARPRLRRQSHPRRRGGVPRRRGAGRRPGRDDALPARRANPALDRPARRAA